MNGKEIKIALVTTGHPPLDDRIFWKFARTLRVNGFDVAVISTTEEFISTVESVRFLCFRGINYGKKEKIVETGKRLLSFGPDIIICSEPLAVFAADRYRKKYNPDAKIIYDITEYYPQIGKGYIKYLYLNWLMMTALNLLAVRKSDRLIIGEELKAKYYRKVTPSKQIDIIGYYSPLNIFNYFPPMKNKNIFTIGYTGLISEERGINRFLEIFRLLKLQHKNLQIKALIIGKFKDESTARKIISELRRYPPGDYEIKEWTDYRNYAETISGIDLCIDLRDKNRLFDNSLPIKLFDMIAAGRRTVITNLRSLKQIDDIEQAAIVTNPNDIDFITGQINSYLSDPENFREDSLYIRKLAERKYNWEREGKNLIKIIYDLSYKSVLKK
ncbi:MAG: glycosyltransferase family 4 protein [Ignavibacteriaceae bacterium]